MRENYINRGDSNRKLLIHLQEEFPHDNNDWKVTILFYSALHYSYSYLTEAGIPISNSHKVNIENLGTIKRDLGRTLNKLYFNSRFSRYTVLADLEQMEEQNKQYHDENFHCLASFIPVEVN